MFNLPPPPPFTLPPPPLLPLDALDLRTFSLICSSIQQDQEQQQQHQNDFHLIFIICFIFCIMSIFLILLFIRIRLYYKRKPLIDKFNSKPISTIQKDLSIYSNCSYETIDSDVYVESINTTHTMISINRSNIMYNQCHPLSSLPLNHDTVFY